MEERQQISYDVIGTIHTNIEAPDDGPIQPNYADTTTGRVSLHEQYVDGLADLEGFSHVVLIYHCHAVADGYSLRVEPFLDETRRGVFATRAPRRPNPIGMSVVALEGIEDCSLSVREIDVVDGTPLLDLKPYVPAFDSRQGATGWMSPPAEGPPADDRFL
jgi:tRNA-Thr(GGU) m(6)t(6)A37 methyltransferase TsaA